MTQLVDECSKEAEVRGSSMETEVDADAQKDQQTSAYSVLVM